MITKNHREIHDPNNRSCCHLHAFFAFAQTCKVISISDGDTFICLDGQNNQVKGRLAEIDAPEVDEPCGGSSRQLLSVLIVSKAVKLDVQEIDRYGRTVARVTRSDGVDVNAEQVRAGAAWAYTKHLQDKSLLVIAAETKKISGNCGPCLQASRYHLGRGMQVLAATLFLKRQRNRNKSAQLLFRSWIHRRILQGVIPAALLGAASAL